MSQPNAVLTLAAACPECEAEVSFAREPRRHEVCRCSSCGAELEVAAVSPLTLELAPEVEEDWGE
ncbi:MAG: lysine biosynthesis protein LysW [Phycisphaerales bacterium]